MWRLLNNFKYNVNNMIKLKELVAKFDEDKENMLLEDFELGRIVREVYPDVKRVKKTSEGQVNMALQSCRNSNKSWPRRRAFSSSVDRIEWLDLPNEITQFNWQSTSISEGFYEWIKLDTQALCDGVHVLSEVKIFKSWNFTVHVDNKEINKDDLGIYDQMASGDWSPTFSTCWTYPLCVKDIWCPRKKPQKTCEAK